MGIGPSSSLFQENRSSSSETRYEHVIQFKITPVTFCEEEFANIVIEDNQDKSIVRDELSRSKSLSSNETDGRPITKRISIPRPIPNTFLLMCKNSYVLIDLRNIIVLGQTGAGKSSTICNLLGQALPKRPSSTNLIEVSPSVYWQSKGTKKLRRVTEENEVEYFKKSILNGAGKESSIIPLNKPSTYKGRATSFPQRQLADVEAFFDSPFMNNVKMAVNREMTNADLKNSPLPMSNQTSTLLYQFIDCGGMPFFRSLLPQFFSAAESTVFFVVHKLTDKLYERAQVRVLKNGHLAHQLELPSNNIEEIHDWLKIAHACSVPAMTIDNHFGKTFMIGTHFDHLQQKCFDNKDLALEAAFTATEHICERVLSDPSRNVLDPEPVFLKNDLAGTDKCFGIQKLRQKLWDYKSPTKPLAIPAMWLAFIKHIRKLSGESNKPVLLLEEFFEIAKTYHIAKNDARKVLHMCREHCLIFYLDNSSYLNKYLFIDMQWLFAVLANILHRPDSYSKGGRHYSNWKELTETGFMSINFHSHLFFHTPQLDCLPSTWVSDLLVQLHLMARVKTEGGGFFCPILLPLTASLEHRNQHDPFHKDVESDALHIIPQNQSLPPGYMARLFTILSNIPNQVKLVYCSSQTSATFQLFTDDPNESYFMRISEDRGGICLEFCNTFPNQVEGLRACSIANRILLMIIGASDVLKNTWKMSPTLDCPVQLENNIKSFPTLFLKCYNTKCCNSYHLCYVHPQPLNKSKPYVQCCLNQNRMLFSDLPMSQMIWLIKLVKDQNEVSVLQQCISRLTKACVNDRAVHGRQIQTYPILRPLMPEHQLLMTTHQRILPQQSKPLERLPILDDDVVAKPLLRILENRSKFILDSYFNLLEDHLDLDICNYLFQYGVISNDERTRILKLNTRDINIASLQPTNRAQAISMLLDALKSEDKSRGFMAFVTALEQTQSMTAVHCSHRIILDHLQNDTKFMKTKRDWLSSLTVSEL